MRWMNQASYADLPRYKRQWFYPSNVVELERAQRICNECPVIIECGHHADLVREKEGVWGGKLRGHIMRRHEGKLGGR